MSLLNRRKRKKYLLEVKLHQEGRGKRWLRLVAGAVALLAIVWLTGYGLYQAGQWSLARMIFENKRYAIQQIVVQNDGVLDPQLVARFAGAQIGQNLLGFDLDLARRNLLLVPLVRKAEVRRVLPDKLIIKLEERMPVAQLQVASAAKAFAGVEFLIDRTGMVLKPLKLADGTVLRPQHKGALPLITGVSLADTQVGRKVANEQIYRALDLIDEFDQSPVASQLEPARVDLSHPRRLIVQTQQGAVLTFDAEEFTQQLRRLNMILQWARQQQKNVRTVDLTVSRSVPVTFVN